MTTLGFRFATLAWVSAAIAATGGVAGWLVGLSDSPVVGVVLPLLFALVMGAGGFHFASRSRPPLPVQQILIHAARATLLFVLAFAICLHLGILARTQVSADVPKPTMLGSIVKASDVDGLTTTQIIRLVGFEERLVLLGLEPDVIRIFGKSYLEESSPAKNKTLAGVPIAGDVEQLETALKAVALELDRANGPRRSAVNHFKENIPMYLGHLQTLRKLAAGANARIPKEHYLRFLEAVGTENMALVAQKEKNEKGEVLTPAPVMNYLPLYALQLAIDVQKTPLEREINLRSSDLDSGDIDMLDEAIKLRLGRSNASENVVPTKGQGRRYSVKH